MPTHRLVYPCACNAGAAADVAGISLGCASALIGTFCRICFLRGGSLYEQARAQLAVTYSPQNAGIAASAAGDVGRHAAPTAVFVTGYGLDSLGVRVLSQAVQAQLLASERARRCRSSDWRRHITPPRWRTTNLLRVARATAT